MEETIVSLATSGGQGAISIIRLSGEKAYELALKHAQRDKLTPRYATLSSLYDNSGSLIDEAIVIYFQNPKSYTGEDLVEFQTHGGSSVGSLLLDELVKSGAKIAAPGEFTKRAVLNEKMDVAKAEAISALISSKSKASVKLLARQMQGDLGKFVDTIREDLIEITAHAEVSIDYADDNIPPDIVDGIKTKIANIEKMLTDSLETSKRRDRVLSGYKVAIIGKPNAGKSSLLNSLLAYERAIVSDIPGTTRDSVEGELLIGEHLVKIIDTAGIREGEEIIEKIGIERSREIAKEADLLIGMFDGSKEFTKDDEEILKILRESEEGEVLAVVNKKDLPQKIEVKKIEGTGFIEISAKESIEPVLNHIKSVLQTYQSGDEHMLVSKRQRESVASAVSELTASLSLLNEGSLELFSYHIQNALGFISEVTKPYNYSEMLDVMFSDFCLGK